jgi:peptide/nickel transport system substrate-binding protein
MRSLAVLAFLLGAACGTESLAARRPDTGVPESERFGGSVLYASGAELQSINPLVALHPLARQVQNHVLFMTLARYDSARVAQPYLACSWRWSADRRTLTLHLRSDVRWHDGTPTTARDVAWTLNAARDPATGYPRLGDVAAIDTVIAFDDSTVVIRNATPPLLDVLTDLAMLPEAGFRDVPRAGIRAAPFNQAPVGNGPFRFRTHDPGRRWVFEANPDFPAALGGRPYVDRLVVVVVDEPTAKLAALASGELDFAGIQPAHAAFVRRDPRLVVNEYPLFLFYVLVYNARRPPFDRPAVRAALTRALDRQAIVDGYLYGFGEVADGPVPPWHPAYRRVERRAHNSDLARQTLAQAGGSNLTFELLTVGSGEAALEQMIQAQLRAIGVTVRIRQLELGAFLDRVNGPARDFDAAVTGVSGDLSLGFLSAMFHSRRDAAPLAFSGIHLRRLDDALDAGDWRAVQTVLDSLEPMTFLYHARGVQGMNRRVRGVRMDWRGELAGIHGWWVAPEERRH